MAINIRTNVASLEAQRHLSSIQREQQVTFQRLSSGYRINSAADDAGGLGVSQSMEAQIRSYAVAERNANDGISMAETADGAAGQIHDILSRLRELAVESSNGSMSAQDRTNLDTEFQTMLNEIDRIANVTKFNGVNLLAGNVTNIDFQVGINTSASDRVTIAFGGIDVAGLAMTGQKVDTFNNAQTAITAIDAAIQTLATKREGFGAAMNRLASSVANLQSMRTNLSAAHSRIKDVDVAEEAAHMAREQVIAQAGTAILTQANQIPQLALNLLKG
jgi:flagellin